MTTIMQKMQPKYVFEKGTHTMWTDEYVATQLLAMHLHPDIELASRKPAMIEQTMDWMIATLQPQASKVLDLGCGPGLYTTRWAARGYEATGIDFSSNSIAYAKVEAQKNNLPITYHCQNYLEMAYEETFDVITMIYCDFGVLSVEERSQLLAKIYKALKPGGCFICDVPNEHYATRTLTNQWEMSEGGFWSPKPYVCLASSTHYPQEQVVLDQHLVFDENGDERLYRFWQHYFDEETMKNIGKVSGFKVVQAFDQVLEDQPHITFYQFEK